MATVSPQSGRNGSTARTRKPECGSGCAAQVQPATGCSYEPLPVIANAISVPAEAAIPPGTVNVHSRLSPEGKAARLALLEYLINTGRPFDPASDSLGHHNAFLPELEAQHVFARNSAGHIAFAYPVSAAPTAHRVLLADGRTFFAMCAVDAMGSHFALRQNITIHSRCAQSGMPVEIAIADGMIDSLTPAETHAIHVDLTKFTNWASTC